MNINELLKEIRTKKGYSLDVLCEKIGFSNFYQKKHLTLQTKQGTMNHKQKRSDRK